MLLLYFQLFTVTLCTHVGKVGVGKAGNGGKGRLGSAADVDASRVLFMKH